MLVDEAHRFSAGTLRELLKLASGQPAPFIVLAGEPALLATVSGLEAHGTTVHPVVALRLQRLTEAQVGGYVAYRLNVAGSAGRALFDPDATTEILRYTGGTPQLINVLCDSAMALAEAHNSQRVGPGEIRDAVQELNWVEFSARTPPRDPAESGTRPAATPARAVAMEIEVRLGRRFVERLALKPGRAIVGRAPDAHIRLNSKFVSRQHCQIITTGDQSFVEDLGSTNGIVVNGKRRRLHRLSPQDQIVIGNYTLTYLESPAAAN
jgi:general secretion pathway protein A